MTRHGLLLAVALASLPGGSPAHAQSPPPQGNRPAPAAVPTGTITCLVIDADTNAPLAGVLVQLQREGISAHTDEQGRATLVDVPAGSHTLFVSTVGYALTRPTVEVRADETQDLTIPLATGTGVYSEEVEVRGRAADPARESVPLIQSLRSGQLQDLRGVLADDPLRAVQALPGVATGDDFRSEFSVRGAPYRHMGISVDGVAAPWLLHHVADHEESGSLSIINSDVLDEVSLASGAYPQRYDGRLGAWLDLGIRAGSRDAFHLRSAVSGTNASIVAEGPIGSTRRGSWLASARQSYLHWLLDRLDADITGNFGFTDVQSKAVWDVSDRHQLQFTFVGGASAFDEEDTEPGPNTLYDGSMQSTLATAALRSTLGGSVVLTQRASIVSQWFQNKGAESQLLAKGSTYDAGYRAEVSWAPATSTLVDVGAEVGWLEGTRLERRYTFRQPGNVLQLLSASRSSGDAWRGAGYAQVQWRGPAGLQVSPGVRVSQSTLVEDWAVTPWVTSVWPFASAWQLRAGFGLYEQSPEFEYVLSPEGRPDLVNERARHLDVGLGRAFGGSVHAQVTYYDRRETGVLRLENSETRLVNGRVVVPVGLAYYANALDGTARGVEMLLRRVGPNGLSGWISYAFGRLQHDDGVTGERYWADFDQRHTFNVYGHYRLSGRTSVSAKFRAGSNFPIQGYLEERSGGALYVGPSRNAVRLPGYARFDARANRTFNFDRRRLTLFVEVLNVLNRTNIGPSDGVIRVRTGEAVGFTEELFPVIPSVGILIEF